MLRITTNLNEILLPNSSSQVKKNTTAEIKKKKFMEQAIHLYDYLNIGSIEMLITIDGKRKYSLAQGQKVNALS